MDPAHLFLSEFWPPFIGATVGMSFMYLVKRSGAEACLPFVNAGSFPELSGRSKDEQRRVLHEASVLAFRHWGSFLPVIGLALAFAVGAAVAHTLSKAGMIPDSMWWRSAICGVFGGLGGWLVGRLSAHYLRPFLRTRLANPA